MLIGLRSQGLHVRHVDVDTAYLNAGLNAELYIQQPKGFDQHDDQGEILVCKLMKAIYGLKQAGLAWFYHLSKLLLKLKFKKSIRAPCLFINNDAVLLATYVDGIVIQSKSQDAITAVEDGMEQHLKIKRL